MRWLAPFVLFLSLSSCSDPQLPSLEVTPPAATLASGQKLQLSVTRHFLGGPVEDVTRKVSYVSSNRAAATVESGEVSALTEMGGVIVRIADPDSDAITTANLTITDARIESIDLVPSPAIVLKPGATHKFTAIANYGNGVTRDVTTEVLWASSTPGAATVGLTPPDIGLVTAIARGETTITATDAKSRVQGQSIVFVSGDAAQLTAIVVSPNPATIPVTQTLQLSALGVYDDGSTKDLTKLVLWASSKETVLTVDANGVAKGVTAGDATLTATSANAKGSAAAKVQ
jgi:uncharacterized protein YjdB